MIIKSLKEVLHFQDDSQKFSFIYRGQTNSDWKLTPKLFREKQSIINSARYELACYRPYLNNNAKYYKHYNSPIEHLINLQHYEGSTRLLDFSNNFFIALFFACYDPFLRNIHNNGKVFVIKKDFFETYFSQSFNFYYIESVKKEMNRLKDVDRFYIVDPQVKNPRMKRQDGLFLLFPLAKLASYQFDIPVTFEDFVHEANLLSKKSTDENSSIWYAHIEVDFNYKTLILKELDELFGINPESIYESEITSEEVNINYKNMITDIEEFYQKLLNKSL